MKKLFNGIPSIIVIVMLGWLYPMGLQARPFAYITNEGDDTVSVIDTTTNAVTATIPVGSNPFGVAVHPDGTRVYVTNSHEGTVSVIDTITNAVIDLITVGSKDDLCYGLALKPDGSLLYVLKGYDGTVAVIDTGTDKIIDTITGVGSLPFGIAVHPTQSIIYVGDAEGGVRIVDTGTHAELARLYTKGFPEGIAVHPDGSKVYVASVLSHTVDVIDTATSAIVATIPVGIVEDDARGVAVTPDGASVYVAGTNLISVINTATNKITNTIPINGTAFGIAVHPDGTTVYAAQSPNTVCVIDTATNAVVSNIAVGDSPTALGLFIGPLTQQSEVTIGDIIKFFNGGIKDGSLTVVGGRPWVAARNLSIMRNKLMLSQKLIAQEKYSAAIQVLKDTASRCDGFNKPMDFVQGQAVSEFNRMISELIDSLFDI
jgi:YVTN family beta-propeller protein